MVRTAATATTQSSTEEKQPTTPVLYASNEVAQHTKEDYLKFFSVDKKTVQTTLSDNVPKKFKDLSKALGDHTLMVRKPALEVVDALESAENTGHRKFLIYGPQGCGKSLALLHILNYAVQKDLVLIYVPNGFRLVDSQTSTEVQHSQWRPGRFDQPKESIIWLNSFRQINMNFLQQNTTSQEYKWGKRETTEPGRPLLELVDQGISRSLFASDAVGAILKEIRANKSLKTMFAVDSFNGLFERSSYALDGKHVDTADLSLAHHFNKLLRPDYNLGDNSSYVFALSQSGQYMAPGVTTASEDYMVLGEQTLDQLGEYQPITVGNYNQREFETVMNFYKSKHWLTRDLTDELLREVKFMTGGNGASVSKYASFI